jgi:tetratricopeptide (TPR) repeat protein
MDGPGSPVAGMQLGLGCVMVRGFRSIHLAGISSVLILLCANPGFSQLPSTAGQMPQPRMDIDLRTMSGASLNVQVRGPDGRAINGMAVVTLCNFGGQPLDSQTTLGSHVVFSPLSAGTYTVYIQIPGYLNAKASAEILDSHAEKTIVVNLQPDSSGLDSLSSLGPMPPKSQKQASKALGQLQAGKFSEAIKSLELAQRYAPKHPEIPYLLGLVYEKKQDLPEALKSWEQAIQLDPKHLPSLLAAADTLLHQDDLARAKPYIDKAVDADANSWAAQILLAEFFLREGSYADAVTHAQRAIRLGKEQANNALLILGQALIAEQQKDQGIAALRSYLASKPPTAQEEAAQKLIERAEHADASKPSVIAPASADLTDLPLTADSLRWIPASVDSAIPPAEPGVSCSLDEVLKKVTARVQELPALVDRFTATEVLRHEDVNESGFVTGAETRSYNYVVSIGINRGKYLSVEEYRDGDMGISMFPHQLASLGLPSIVLIFHPLLISDFNMHCEGLGRIHGKFAWQVYFEQRHDRESRIRRYRINGRVFPIALKGRAWIDANTYQIVQLETDLREPHPDIRLLAEHLAVQYGPVHFKNRKEVLWLPSSADYYAIFRGHRFHRRHSFTNYILFSVEDKQKIGEPPKEKSTTDRSDDKKSPD